MQKLCDWPEEDTSIWDLALCEVTAARLNVSDSFDEIAVLNEWVTRVSKGRVDIIPKPVIFRTVNNNKQKEI